MSEKKPDGRGKYERKAGVHTLGKKSKSLTFLVDGDIFKAIESQLETSGSTLADWLRDAVTEKLERDS